MATPGRTERGCKPRFFPPVSIEIAPSGARFSTRAHGLAAIAAFATCTDVSGQGMPNTEAGLWEVTGADGERTSVTKLCTDDKDSRFNIEDRCAKLEEMRRKMEQTRK
jgi:hypothetical protein